MRQIVIKVKNDGREILASEGEILSKVLLRNGYDLPLTCGGKGTCGRCLVEKSGIGILSCSTFLTENMEIFIPYLEENIYVQQGIKETGKFHGDKACFALDIGTTTVTIALLDGEDGVTETVTFKNPQSRFGSDVISRINAVNIEGTEALKRPLIDSISNAINNLVKKYFLKAVREIFVCGNTTMLHIFWGEDCTTLGYHPYTARFLERKEGKSKEIGFPFECKVLSLSGISSFVGSDVAAGLVTAQIPREGKKSIWIDFGTNAEVAVFSSKEYITTSTAAGPCFEGANISCGMPATEGAITSFRLGESGIPEINYIGKKPIGLCGTGLIDVIAELIKHGIIDSTGYLTLEKGFPIINNIVLTQKDIREFQLAKAAIRSGIETLLDNSGTSYEEIDKVYLAGGFSSYISVESAAICGIIPRAFTDRCVSIANAALKGTILCAQGKADERLVVKLSKPVELNEQVKFNDTFIEYIGF
ncbi:MAG: ASKHA domain-containing protein [Clostridia bacterium]|jgi:uncharacterized 2Fe-2S/4Fe-4S cluster protein (DUF4445 family)|nr:ASKHA domain-containing protein [Clostridia bacterium]NLT18876.1 DUF4445 domain-containing protein [Clostridiales bacterium]OQC12853.1 MAG: 2Fe-2S iron-sulfur cluster binding domain protein [Firmicutes bacterium ADurb.Bin080]